MLTDTDLLSEILRFFMTEITTAEKDWHGDTDRYGNRGKCSISALNKRYASKKFASTFPISAGGFLPEQETSFFFQEGFN